MDVRPSQGEQLALPHPGSDRESVERTETVTCNRRDERTRLVRGGWVHFVLGLVRRVHERRDVSDDLVGLERATEGDPKDRVGIPDGCAGEIAPCRARRCHSPGVIRLELRGSDAPDGWMDVLRWVTL
jgi:hypothetical protein